MLTLTDNETDLSFSSYLFIEVLGSDVASFSQSVTSSGIDSPTNL